MLTKLNIAPGIDNKIQNTVQKVVGPMHKMYDFIMVCHKK